MDDPAGRPTQRWMLRIGKTRIVPALCDELWVRMLSESGSMARDPRRWTWFANYTLRMVVATSLWLLMVMLLKHFANLHEVTPALNASMWATLLVGAVWNASLAVSVDESGMTVWRLPYPIRIPRERVEAIESTGAAATLRMASGSRPVPLSVLRAVEASWPECVEPNCPGEEFEACARRLPEAGLVTKDVPYLPVMVAAAALLVLLPILAPPVWLLLLLALGTFVSGAASDVMPSCVGPKRLRRNGVQGWSPTRASRFHPWRDLRGIRSCTGSGGRVHWLLSFGDGYVYLPQRNPEINVVMAEMEAVFKAHQAVSDERLAAEPIGANLVEA